MVNGRRGAAIDYHHTLAEHEPPTNQEGVKVVLRGIRRTIGTARAGKGASRARYPRPDAGPLPRRRDRDGLRVLIRRSKTDQSGQGQEVAIPRGYKLRPVEAVQTWLASAEISTGPVFRAVAKGGRVSAKPLSDDSASRVVKRYAAHVGLEAAAFAGHSLRSGFVTSAAESGASILKIQETSRHKSTDVLAGYVRRVDLFKDHAGAAFL